MSHLLVEDAVYLILFTLFIYALGCVCGLRADKKFHAKEIERLTSERDKAVRIAHNALDREAQLAATIWADRRSNPSRASAPIFTNLGVPQHAELDFIRDCFGDNCNSCGSCPSVTNGTDDCGNSGNSRNHN